MTTPPSLFFLAQCHLSSISVHQALPENSCSSLRETNFFPLPTTPSVLSHFHFPYSPPLFFSNPPPPTLSSLLLLSKQSSTLVPDLSGNNFFFKRMEIPLHDKWTTRSDWGAGWSKALSFSDNSHGDSEKKKKESKEGEYGKGSLGPTLTGNNISSHLDRKQP